jgi:hypothetical protein
MSQAWFLKLVQQTLNMYSCTTWQQSKHIQWYVGVMQVYGQKQQTQSSGTLCHECVRLLQQVIKTTVLHSTMAYNQRIVHSLLIRSDKLVANQGIPSVHVCTALLALRTCPDAASAFLQYMHKKIGMISSCIRPTSDHSAHCLCAAILALCQLHKDNLSFIEQETILSHLLSDMKS